MTTPRPWSVEETEYRVWLSGPAGEHITDGWIARENAHLIAACVNAFAVLPTDRSPAAGGALVAAAGELIAVVEILPGAGDVGSDLWVTTAILRDALTAATGAGEEEQWYFVRDGGGWTVARGLPLDVAQLIAALPALALALEEAISTVSDVMTETLEHGHLQPRIERWEAALTAATGAESEAGHA
jgi:hypothetical protein